MTELTEEMREYSTLMAVSKYEEALEYLSGVTNKLLEASFKSNQSVCLMLDDPDSLGVALVSHFLLVMT